MTESAAAIGREFADLEPPGLTDLGNAVRLRIDFGQDIRWVEQWHAFFVWAVTHWQRDDVGDVMRMAKARVRSILAEAAYEDNDAMRKKLAQHAVKSQSEPALRRMVELLKSEPGIPVRPSDLDAGLDVFNTPSGVVDLRTGNVRHARRDDLMTRIAAAPYQAGTHHPVFDKFLARVLPDPELRAFVQEWAGYCLTGRTSEEKFVLVYGPTASAKSTLLRALRTVMGTYAAVADFNTFTEKDHGGPKEDIARLAGARLVISVETKDNTRLADGLLKWITGGDGIAARRLYGRTFEFIPQFKLMFASNYRPRTRDDDDAMWRRALEVPFTHSIPEAERDPEIKAVLCDPERGGPAVLAWAVEGAARWYRQRGLAIPAAVRQATAAYRADMDPLREFLTAVCVIEDGAYISAGELRSAYEAWAREQGIRHPIAGKAFTARLEAKGCKPARTATERGWKGIRLRGVLDRDGNDANDANDATSDTFLYARAHEESLGNGVIGVMPSSPEPDGLPGWVTEAEP